MHLSSHKIARARSGVEESQALSILCRQHKQSTRPCGYVDHPLVNDMVGHVARDCRTDQAMTVIAITVQHAAKVRGVNGQDLLPIRDRREPAMNGAKRLTEGSQAELVGTATGAHNNRQLPTFRAGSHSQKGTSPAPGDRPWRNVFEHKWRGQIELAQRLQAVPLEVKYGGRLDTVAQHTVPIPCRVRATQNDNMPVLVRGATVGIETDRLGVWQRGRGATRGFKPPASTSWFQSDGMVAPSSSTGNGNHSERQHQHAGMVGNLQTP